MSMEKINLRKLLQLFYAEPRYRRSLLMGEIRGDLVKQIGGSTGGGDFYTPFWADAKSHVGGISDLRERTKVRIEKNKARSRLYPLLMEGFLKLWNEKARWRNERFEFVAANVSVQLPVQELNAIIKIENVVAVKMQDESHRLVYPYFSEKPMLPLEGARLGFWALKEALPNFRTEDLRIVDVLRSSYFRPAESPSQGNERNIFVQKYDAVLKEWRKLRDES